MRVTRRSSEDFPGLELLEPRQLLFAISWDGGAGDNDWHNPLNWYGDILPGPQDDVFINIAGTPTISITQDVSVRSIMSVEAIHLAAGSVNIGTLWKQSAPLTISGGEVTGPGNLALGAGGTWIGGSLAGAGKLQILPSAELIIDGNVVLARELVNNGSLAWNSGDIAAHNARIHNLKGRTFLIHSAGTLLAASGDGILINGGTIALEGAPGQTTTIQITLNNHARPIQLPIFNPWSGSTVWNTTAPGIVDVRSGTLSFTGEVLQKQGGILRGGEWWVTSSDAMLLLPGPDITKVQNWTGSGTTIIMRGPGSSFPQFATATEVSSLTLENRAFPITVSTHIFHLTINSPGITTTAPGQYVLINRLDLLGGLFTVNDYHALITFINAGAELRILGQWRMLQGIGWNTGDRVFGAGTLRITGTMRVAAGRLEASTMIISPSGRLEMVGDPMMLAQRSITSRIINYGTIDWSGPDIWRIHGELVNRGTFNIRASGFVETSAGTGPDLAPAYFHNFGTLKLLEGAVMTFRGAGGGVHFLNRGFVHVQNGRLNLFGGVTSGIPNFQAIVPNWTVHTNSELAIGGLAATIHGAIFSAPGTIRIGSHVQWHASRIEGGGTLIIGPTGRLDIRSASEFNIASTANSGVVSVAPGATAQFSGAFQNSGTLIVAGELAVGALGLAPTSTLRIRSAGPGQHGHITTGTFNRAGNLIIDFQSTPFIALLIPIYTANLSASGQFTDVSATGLSPGLAVQHSTTPFGPGVVGRITLV